MSVVNISATLSAPTLKRKRVEHPLPTLQLPHIHTKSNKEIISFDHLETVDLCQCSESAHALCAVRVSGGFSLAVPQFLGVSLTPISSTKVGDLVAAAGSST